MSCDVRVMLEGGGGGSGSGEWRVVDAVSLVSATVECKKAGRGGPHPRLAPIECKRAGRDVGELSPFAAA